MFGRNGKKGNYAYTVARVKAKKSLLLKEEDYSKMMMMSVPEISRYINETGYQKEMVDLAGRSTGLDLLERATYLNLAKVFSSILSASTGELNDMVSAYLMKWDIWNVKVILRGKSYGLGADGIRDDLVPAGSLNMDALEKLMALSSDEDVLTAFAKMVHVTIPAEVLASFKSGTYLGDVEDFLDKYRYARLLSSIDVSSRPSRLFYDYIRNEIDVKNLETILKLRIEGIKGDSILNYFIPGGKQIDLKMATQFANAESVESVLSDIAQLDFYEDIKEALESKGTSLRGIVSGMKAYEMNKAKKFSHLYPLSVVPVLDYMIHKENEVNNIRLIARGIDSGLNKDVIKGLLVI